MGFLVDVRSQRPFVLEREDFPRALRALKRLAKELPGEFDDPDGAARAKSLEQALPCWRLRFDDFGDLVDLAYQVDKAPRDAADFWPSPLLDELAKAGARGCVRYWCDADEHASIFWLDGTASRSREATSFASRAVGDPPSTIAPGASVSLVVEGGDLADDAPLAVTIGSDWSPTSSGEWGPADGATATFDASPLRAGERREITVRAAPSAHGSLAVDVRTGGRTTRFRIAVDPSPDDLARPWIVLEQRSRASISMIVPKGAIKKVHERVRRFAARSARLPGGAFLEAVAAAPSLDEALAAAGVALRSDAKGHQELVLVQDRLPGDEPVFAALLDTLATHASRHCRSGLFVRFDRAPGVWRKYSVYRGGMERGTTNTPI